jgi:hypothetical protein
MPLWTVSVSAAAPCPCQRLSVLYARLLSQSAQPTYPRCTTPANSVSIYRHVSAGSSPGKCHGRGLLLRVMWHIMQVPGAGLRALRPRPSAGAARGGLSLFRRARASDDPRHALGLVAVAGVAHLSEGLTRVFGGKDAHSPQAPNNFFDAKETLH